MSDDEFLTKFEDCTLPDEQFHHADHLRAGWLYLKRFQAPEAIARFSKTLRQYATSLGKPDRYHETITWAYLALLNERIACAEPNARWQDFASANPDLFDWQNSILRKYYRDETLQSDRARRIFVMPDRLCDVRGHQIK